MKIRICLFLFVATFFARPLWAQQAALQGFSYQAIVRDASGAVLSNQPVVFYFDIREGTPQGNTSYSESQEATTNEFGLVNLYVGQGKPVGATRFSGVDWAANSKFLTISLDPGTGHITNLGTSQLMSVPYALFAAKAGESNGDNDPSDDVTVTTLAGGQLTGTFDNLQIAQQGAYVGQVLKWDGAKWAPGADEKEKEGPEFVPTTVPVGAILPWAGPYNTVPVGWLLCDGQAISRAGTYAPLFAITGVSWGQGNGTTTFNIPDLRGQFLRGADLGIGNDPDANTRAVQTSGVGLSRRDAGSKQADSMQGHAHKVKLADAAGNVGDGVRIVTPSTTGSLIGLVRNDKGGPTVYNPLTVTGIIQDGSYGVPRQSIETRPKNVNVNYIIKI